MSISIAVIGFGEVGRIFSEDLLKGGANSVSSYDILFESPAGASIWQIAKDMGVRPAHSAHEACRDAEIVFSAVTADAAEAVAGEAAGYLKPGQILFDINSASPTTKARAYAAVTPSGAVYVEGAVMQPVPAPRLAVPIISGGPKAERVAELLNPLGMAITPLPGEVGLASATKLCRSIMIKGIEALMLDCAEACAYWGVGKDVFASLDASFQAADWSKLAEEMPKRVHAHGIRRAAEMREAAQMLKEMGRDPALISAVAERQQANARPR